MNRELEWSKGARRELFFVFIDRLIVYTMYSVKTRIIGLRARGVYKLAAGAFGAAPLIPKEYTRQTGPLSTCVM